MRPELPPGFKRSLLRDRRRSRTCSACAAGTSTRRHRLPRAGRTTGAAFEDERAPLRSPRGDGVVVQNQTWRWAGAACPRHSGLLSMMADISRHAREQSCAGTQRKATLSRPCSPSAKTPWRNTTGTRWRWSVDDGGIAMTQQPADAISMASAGTPDPAGGSGQPPPPASSGKAARLQSADGRGTSVAARSRRRQTHSEHQAVARELVRGMHDLIERS